MLKPSEYKHIIWDWNGTLLNDAWLFVDIMNDVLINRNMNTITVEKYREIFSFPVKDYYKKLGFDLNKESFHKSGMEFIKAYKKRRYEADLYPRVNTILSKLLSSLSSKASAVVVLISVTSVGLSSLPLRDETITDPVVILSCN